MPPLRTTLAAAALVLTTLCTAGCERAIFGFANRGLAAPEATVSFAPDSACRSTSTGPWARRRSR